jgi:hypothetical protein
MRKIFISYVKEDEHYLSTILNWKKQDQNLNIEFITDRLLIKNPSDNSLKTKTEIEDLLKPLIDASNAILLLVGNDTHNKPWIEWEYNYAQNHKLKIALMQIPNSTGNKPKLVPEQEMFKMNLKNLRKIMISWKWL